MISFSLSDISTILNASYYGDNLLINSVFVDSRTLVSPSSLFVAIVGERHNGHNYIHDLYKQGVRAFLVSELPKTEDYIDAGFVLVNNTLSALQKLSAHYLQQLHCTVVGVTGSNGKTIVKEWIYQLLQDSVRVIRSPKSYNSQIGVPLSVLLASEDDKLAVFEAGISQVGEMQKLENIIKPDIGIFTNIGEAHQENFISIEQKINEKLLLFINAKTLIYCSDNEQVDSIIKSSISSKTKLFTWGIKGAPILKVKSIINNGTATDIQAICNNLDFNFTIPFIDNASIDNALHCVSLLLVLGYDYKFIKQHIKQITPIAMRLELKEGINGCTVINDTYNSDINSLTIALDFLGSLSQHTYKTIILSDILQSGKHEVDLYIEVAKLIEAKNVNRIIGIGQTLKKHAELFKIDGEFFNDTDEFLRIFNRKKFQNEVVLLKGSRDFKFERISKLLEKKIHQTILEVNLNALTNNLNYFKSLLKPATKIMAMVKAFSYGSGSYEIASLLQYQRVDYLGVAFADEGVALREAGITMPIVVLNAESTSFETMLAYQLEPEIYSFKSLEMFSLAASKIGLNECPIHIKIDTGMHRLGFTDGDIDNLINNLQQNKQVKVSTIFCHLAASDEDKHNDFTLKQISDFKHISQKLINGIAYQPLRHILNSAGIERFSDDQFDMVRLGIGLYGVSAVKNKHLQNVSTLKSTIVQIKDIQKGDTVGYGRCGMVEHDKRIATIPIGYADGFSRHFSRGIGYFMVNGQPAPIIGNICMDTCMIDITGIEANEGDRVVIWGEQPTVSEMAESIDTIPYEILSALSQRVKRMYYSE